MKMLVIGAFFSSIMFCAAAGAAPSTVNADPVKTDTVNVYLSAIGSICPDCLSTVHQVEAKRGYAVASVEDARAIMDSNDFHNILQEKKKIFCSDKTHAKETYCTGVEQ